MDLKEYLAGKTPVKEEKCPQYDKFKEIAANHIKTAFIGAIASFEENFGFLWGHGHISKTKEEEKLFEIWSDCRKEILDKGNIQVRLAKSSIDNSTPETIVFLRKQ